MRNQASGASAKVPPEGEALPNQRGDSLSAPNLVTMTQNHMEQKAGLKQKLNDDLRQALRSGDKAKISTIRLLLSAIKNAEIAKMAVLEDADIFGVISKEIRQRQESIEAFKKGNRADLVAQEEAEMAVLQSYLPKQMTHEEIIAAAKQVIAEVGAIGPADKGKVMPKIIAQLKGKADGREINAVVTELLTSS